MKKFGKKAGALVLMAPFIAMTANEGVSTSKMDEPSKNDCGDACSKSCRNICFGLCRDHCDWECKGTCKYSCMWATRLD